MTTQNEIPSSTRRDDEAALLASLRAGDEAAFVDLLDRHTAPMLRLARVFVATPEAAADVVQDTWLGVLRGLERFEARASLRTWIFRILVNRARTRGQGDARTVPFSALAAREADAETTTVDARQFSDDPASWPGHWLKDPRPWAPSAEDVQLSAELLARVREAIDRLPTGQRTVITLRDVEGWGSDEVCELLEITAGNQRVLLHRARARIRTHLDGYLRGR